MSSSSISLSKPSLLITYDIKSFITNIYNTRNFILYKTNKFNKSNKTEQILEEVKKYSPMIPIEEAYVPPSSWYIDSEFYKYEIQKVFKTNWLGLVSDHGLNKPGDYISGELFNQPYIIVKNSDNQLKAFYNVCSHHASTICNQQKGSCRELVCPYHGWTYNLNGQLTKCTSMKGIKNFKLKENGLKPINIDRIGNIQFLNFDKNLNNMPFNSSFINMSASSQFQTFVKPFTDILRAKGFNPNFSDLIFVQKKEYRIKCNWKVFIDNYCDGGYHVPFAHKNLNETLDLSSYTLDSLKKLSIQYTNSSTNKDGTYDKRVGTGAVYCYIYPNIMFNRYGPWLDTNVVIPINENECIVVIEWFIDKNFENDTNFIKESLLASEEVQHEDVWLCENVMKGILSDAYDKGRYVPNKESPAYAFHQDLLEDLLNEDKESMDYESKGMEHMSMGIRIGGCPGEKREKKLEKL